MSNERKMYYMKNSDVNEATLLSLTLDQVELLNFLVENRCLSPDISFRIVGVNNPQVITGSEWYDYIAE